VEAAASAALGPQRERRNIFADNMERPADIFLASFVRGRDAAIDVGVTSPLQAAQVRREASQAGAALEAYKNIKNNKYHDQCSNAGIEFVPLIVETLGGWDSDAVLFINRIARQMGRRSSADEDTASRHLYQKLAIRLQKGNAALLIGRRPTPPPASIVGPD
jgi:hypothetical protein